jgi:hypothetical protein
MKIDKIDKIDKMIDGAKLLVEALEVWKKGKKVLFNFKGSLFDGNLDRNTNFDPNKHLELIVKHLDSVQFNIEKELEYVPYETHEELACLIGQIVKSKEETGYPLRIVGIINCIDGKEISIGVGFTINPIQLFENFVFVESNKPCGKLKSF